jgi:hypothetical protein
MTSGDGCTESAHLLGLLGLPNDTTMETRSFATIEDRISPSIQQLTDAILDENLREEVRLTLQALEAYDDNDFYLRGEAMAGRVQLNTTKRPSLSVSFDMAWQQRNSGNRYASSSGHALLVGKFTRKPLMLCIKSKVCNYCKAWKKKHGDLEDALEHDCRMNHDGSSGAMEPVACLEMVVFVHEKKHCDVVYICCDNNASTRSLLKWRNADYMNNTNTTEPPKVPISRGPNKGKLQVRPDKGRLPPTVPEPVFIADPNHRKKVLTGELITLLQAKVAERATLTRMDTTRIGKNFGYMIRSLKQLPENQYLQAGQAVLEHHFNNHIYCGEWCRRKRQSDAERRVKDHYYRSMQKGEDAKLYGVLQDKIARFISVDRLHKVAHGMDTQVNESFNNTVSWFAPKNKVYCGTSSLTNRVGFAVSITSVGVLEYFRRLF